MMYVYGTYLLHGGSYDRFIDMDLDDVQLMLDVVECTRLRNMKDVADMIGRLVGSGSEGMSL